MSNERDEQERLKRRRALMHDNVSIERAWDEINRAARERYNGAPAATVEALMFSLRERGPPALQEPDTRRRLRELSDDQLIAIEQRLQTLKLGRGPWSVTEIKQLVLLREEIRK